MFVHLHHSLTETENLKNLPLKTLPPCTKSTLQMENEVIHEIEECPTTSTRKISAN